MHSLPNVGPRVFGIGHAGFLRHTLRRLTNYRSSKTIHRAISNLSLASQSSAQVLNAIEERMRSGSALFKVTKNRGIESETCVLMWLNADEKEHLASRRGMKLLENLNPDDIASAPTGSQSTGRSDFGSPMAALQRPAAAVEMASEELSNDDDNALYLFDEGAEDLSIHVQSISQNPSTQDFSI